MAQVPHEELAERGAREHHRLLKDARRFVLAGGHAIAAGQNAAYECGDLRIVQALPATTTMGKRFMPTLIYNSRLARAAGLLQTRVYYNGAAPAALQAVMSLGGSPDTLSRSYSWSPSCIE